MKEFDGRARAAGIALFNELGLDPGIDHVEAMACMDAARARGGKVQCVFCDHLSSFVD